MRTMIPVVAVALAVVTLIVVLTVWATGGFKAEPNYTSWCDAPTGNRLFLFNNGSGTVVPADSLGAKC